MSVPPSRPTTRLATAYDDCRDLFCQLAVESDGPNDKLLTWGSEPPLPFYHQHQAALAEQSMPAIRVRLRAIEGRSLELTPLLSVQRCGVCGQWQAFFFDRYERKKHRTWFLDFVEGHSHNRRDLLKIRKWSEQVREADASARLSEQPKPDEPREPPLELFCDFVHEFEPPVYLARQVADFMNSHDG